jgi:hypothetical protein
VYNLLLLGVSRDELMNVGRVVRSHWDKPRWARVVQAFATMYHKSLYNWVRCTPSFFISLLIFVLLLCQVDSETSGSYKDLMLALIRAT